MSLKKQVELYNSKDKLNAINWNKEDDPMAEIYWLQGVQQFWLETEFDVSRDLGSWNKLSEPEKDTYKKVLAGLTGLDTKQGGEGMNLISYHEPRSKYQAVFAFMGGMEEIH